MKLYSTVFITGFTILFLEIIGSRLISPVYGNTIFVWSSLIGVTIASLALGYYLGGKFSQNNPNRIGYPIIIGVMWIPLLLIFKEVLPVTTFLGVQLGSLVSAVILLAFPLTLLGMISPVLIQLSKKEKGLASGNIFAVGTMGSFFGAILTGFILIPNVPISYMLVTVPVFSILIGGYWLSKQKSIIPVSITVTPYAIIVLISLMMVVPPAEAVLFETESLYGNIKLIETEHHKKLFYDGSLQSITKHNNESVMAFTQYSIVPLFYNSNVNEVLVLGLGSGSITKEYEQITNTNIDTIEIDEQIVHVANTFFDNKANVIVGDARHYMKTTDKMYDVIIYDLSRGDSYPTHLFTSEAFAEAKSILNDDGILLVHQSGSIDSKMIKAYYTTIDHVFENVNIVSFENTPSPANQMKLYIASDSDLILDTQKVKTLFPLTEGDNYINNLERIAEIESGQIITDDFNPLDIWQLEYVDEWRQGYWEMLK